MASTPIIVGEQLFDHLPDGSAVQGGAPFNVASHLKGFGGDPLLIGRLGSDQWGEQVLQRMQQRGLRMTGIQRDPIHPTGQVKVSLVEGQPSYEIVLDQAYDFIEATQALAAIEATGSPGLLYHGTLAHRTPEARQQLQTLWQQTQVPTFLDLNLRDPWWDQDWIITCLEQATWVKLNDHELASVVEEQISPDTLEQQARAVQLRFNLSLLVVTLGAKGALLLTPGQIIHQDPVAVPELVNTVGAGDAFCSVVIWGLLQDWDPRVTLARAAHFAAHICGLAAATPDPSVYPQILALRP
ncbi:MAG: carbohydrate kinase [Cyanophyceae cyanobacterium]